MVIVYKPYFITNPSLTHTVVANDNSQNKSSILDFPEDNSYTQSAQKNFSLNGASFSKNNDLNFDLTLSQVEVSEIEEILSSSQQNLNANTQFKNSDLLYVQKSKNIYSAKNNSQTNKYSNDISSIQTFQIANHFFDPSQLENKYFDTNCQKPKRLTNFNSNCLKKQICKANTPTLSPTFFSQSINGPTNLKFPNDNSEFNNNSQLQSNNSLQSYQFESSLELEKELKINSSIYKQNSKRISPPLLTSVDEFFFTLDSQTSNISPDYSPSIQITTEHFFTKTKDKNENSNIFEKDPYNNSLHIPYSNNAYSPSYPSPPDHQNFAPIQRYRRRPILSVTSFSSQLWCEKQYEFYLKTGKKRETKALIAGSSRHDDLEKQDHEVVKIPVSNWEEHLALTLNTTIILFQQLLNIGKCREVSVYGNYEGILLNGIIDELELRKFQSKKDSGSQFDTYLHLIDTKTRSTLTEPSSAQKKATSLQLQLYYLMINQMRTNEFNYQQLLEIYSCDPNLHFTIPQLSPFTNLFEVIESLKAISSLLPPLYNEMEIAYEYEGQEFSRCIMPYNEQSLYFTLDDLLFWWKGNREANYVQQNESFKCKLCDFLEICKGCPLPPTEIISILDKRRKERVLKSLYESIDHGIPDILEYPQLESSSEIEFIDLTGLE